MNSASRSVTTREPTDCHDCPIRQLALFRPIQTDQLDTVKSLRTAQREIPPSTELYREGDRIQESFTLFSGWVIRYKTLEDGRRQILGFALPGDLLCFQPDLGAPNTHSAQTLTPVVLCAFPADDLIQMFRRYPELAIQMSWITSRDEAIYHEHLINLGRRPARERIAHLLLELHYRLTVRNLAEPDEPVTLPLNQEHIADAVGLTTIHVSRTLRTLREERLLNYQSGVLTLFDRPTLVELTGFHEDVFQPRPTL